VAVDKAGHNAYDLILMDMQMPVLDGLAATRAIRQLPGHDNLPIIAMTANAMASERERCIDAGMNDHLPKPIDPDELVVKLRQWIQPVTSSVTPTENDQQTTAAVDAPAHRILPGLRQIDGLDVDTGLRQSLGHPSLYLALLEKFVDGQNKTPASITESLSRADNHDAAERLAGTLKGAAAQIGANCIAALAEQLEIAIRDQRSADALAVTHHELSRQLSALIDALRTLLPGMPEVPPLVPHCGDSIDVDLLRMVCLRLSDSLNNDDFSSSRLLDENETLLSAALGEQFLRIADTVRCYNFPAALNALQAAVRPYGISLIKAE
jgi:CheY-like chemotaxis protein